ncbi:MAG: hypothetical protein A2Y33_02995 [Spirochaetes bacterium GWF1_51_8]|nr:MAG: hypothetical protein A2Y33_02995 [Spirochaetes bacterium GWF1_51_8]
MKRIFGFIITLFFLVSCGSQHTIKQATEGAVDGIAWKIASKVDASKVVVAVAEFEPVQKSDKVKGIVKTISEMMVGKLNDRGIKVVENAQLNQLVKEKKLALSGMVDTEFASQIGTMTGAGYILLGSVSLVSGEIFINARLVDINTRVVVATAEGSFNLDEIEKQNEPKKPAPVDTQMIANTPNTLLWFSWGNLLLNYPVLVGIELIDFNVIFFSPTARLGIGLGFGGAKAYLTDWWFVPNTAGANGLGALFPLKLYFPLYIHPDKYVRNDVYIKAEVGGILFNEGPDKGDADGDEYFDISVVFMSKFKLSGVSLPISVGVGAIFASETVSYNFNTSWTIYAQFSLGIGGYSAAEAMSE